MKKLFLLFSLLLCLFSNYDAKASHFAGAEIWYEYVSPLVYKVHVGSYLDCGFGGANYYFSTLCVSSVNAGYSQTFSLDTTGVGAIDPFQNDTISQLCSNANSWCSNTSSIYPAYLYRHFINTITLPSAQMDWKFGVSDGARDGSISNGFANQQISVEAELNNLIRPYNSSTQFSFKPMPFVCVNQPQVYQSGSYDPDLDSVYFEAINPLGGNCANQSSLAFSPGFSINNPIPCFNWYINPFTGAVGFTSNTMGTYVFAFKATDYDKNTGAKMGSSIRDLKINVITCSTPPPIVDSVYQVTGCSDTIIGGQHVLTVCPGSNIHFNVAGHTSSTSNQLVSYANLSTLNTFGSTASYTTDTSSGGASGIVGSFNWTPSAQDYGNHTLIITFADTTCTPGLQPFVSKNYATILIRVLTGVSAGGPYNYCPGGDSLQLIATGPAGITTWNWSVIPGQVGMPQANFSNSNIYNPTIVPSATMDIVVEGLPVVTGCPNKDTVTLNVFTPLIVNAGTDMTPCANDAIAFNATINRPLGSTINTWLPTTYFTSGNASLHPTLSPLASQQYILKVKDSYGCKSTDTINVAMVGIRPIISAYANRDTVCLGEEVKLFANASAQPCGVSSNACTGMPSNKIIGNGTYINANFSPFYKDFNAGYRAQYLIRADELINAGLSPGNINGLTMQVQSAPSDLPTDSLLGFKIRMGCTSLNSLSKTMGFVNGLPQVYSINKYAPFLGNNSFNFPINSELYWDGKSNVVIEVCYNLLQFGNGQPATVYSSITPFSSSLVDQDFQNGGCNLAGIGFNAAVSPLRPNFKLLFCKTNTFTYSWAPSSAFANTESTKENPTVKQGFINGPTTFTVTVESGAMGQCNESDVVNLIVDNAGGVDPKATPAYLCEPGLTTLSATALAGTQAPLFQCGEENFITNGPAAITTLGVDTLTYDYPFYQSSGAKVQYLFAASELIAAGIQKGRIDELSFNIIDKNSVAPYLSYTMSLGCTAENALNSFINIGMMKQVYQSSAYYTDSGWNNFTLQAPFLWDGTNNLVLEVCYGGHSDFNSDMVAYSNVGFSATYVEYNYTNNGCDIPLSIKGIKGIFGSTGIRPNTRFKITPVQNKEFQFAWTPSLFIYDSTKSQTLAYVKKSRVYTVSVANKRGCLFKDTVHVIIPFNNIALSPSDTSICLGDSFPLRIIGDGVKLPASYQWSANNVVLPNNDIAIFCHPEIETNYSVVRSDQYGCIDTAFSKVKILPIPPLKILNGDSIRVSNGSSINLIANGATNYHWTSDFNITLPEVSSILLYPTEDGNYYVKGTNEYGCGKTDNIFLDVYYDHPSYIPNAFSPNGDGYNDVFKMINYDQYQVFYLRVYSRNGNLVFKGKANQGWDGTCDGKQMEMDTYMYVIKYVENNGNVKRFGGDVLLMR
jgi:gliding motility-associated-like protein